METVFDLATPEELKKIHGECFDDADYERFRQYALEDPDCNNAMLASLYSIRGDMKRADSAVASIQDPESRLEAHFSIYGCTHGAI